MCNPTDLSVCNAVFSLRGVCELIETNDWNRLVFPAPKLAAEEDCLRNNCLCLVQFPENRPDGKQLDTVSFG